VENYTFEQLIPLLNRVEKPGRYTGGEVNSCKPTENDLRFSICYPDLYEVGMANQGLQILYDRLNRQDGVSCERFFAPALDFFNELKKEGLTLYSLETYTPVHKMDAIGFNLSYELLFTNLLYILDSAGIALFSRERTEDDPIVIGGGEAVSNPAPISLFVDCIFAGEGEEGIVEIANTLKENRNQSRAEKLYALSSIEGVFVPTLYEERINNDGMKLFTGKAVSKRFAPPEALANPLWPVIPSIRTSQERAVIEITRGCDNLCKFCHAGYYTLPYRQCSVEKTVKETITILDNTGYDGVTFTSLSLSDYKDLIPLLNKVLPELNRRGVNINLPSLKVDSGTLPIIMTISGVKQVNLTFAVEAAHTEIRKLIHKRVSEDELLKIVNYVFQNGWKTIKLYFMLGLPGYRTYDEADSIIELLRRVFDAGRGKKSIHVTVSPFIPKPHTPFDMVDMASKEYFHAVVDKLKSSLPRKIAVKNHNIDSSYVEGFLARGDIEMGRALYEAYQAGCTFDSWSEHFNSRAWLPIVEKFSHRADYFGERTDREQSWNIITTASEKLIESKRERVLTDEELSKNRMNATESLDTEAIEASMKEFEQSYIKQSVIRCVFTKKGRARYISHLDLVEIVKRSFHRAGLPLCYSRGFNKRAKIGGGFPLPLGLESSCEVFDCELYSSLPEETIDKINNALPEGIELLSLSQHNETTIPLARNTVTAYTITAEAEILNKIGRGIVSDITLKKKTKRGETEIMIADSVHSHQSNSDCLTLFLHTGVTNALRIDSILNALINAAEFAKTRITRSGLYTTGQDPDILTNMLQES
jgi:radical SAM family uncharacterized protein/radical SAM-linked protein